jgi:hypothetical protein
MNQHIILQGTYCMPLIINNCVKLCLNVLTGHVVIALIRLVQFSMNKCGVSISVSRPDLSHLRCNILFSLLVDAKLGSFLISAFRKVFVYVTTNLMS